MKRSISIILSILWLFAAQSAPAQGTLYVSNLGQTPTGSASIGSDSWIAQAFYLNVTDPNRYFLNSMQLLINPASGSPNGFAVSIYSAASPGGGPQVYLGSLNGSANPSTAGIYTYTVSSITLSGGVYYYVVATAATPVARGAYNWSAANSFTSANGWNIDDAYFSSANGSAWTFHFRENVFQMALYGTPVPEPSTLVLLLVGLGVLAGRRRWTPAVV